MVDLWGALMMTGDDRPYQASVDFYLLISSIMHGAPPAAAAVAAVVWVVRAVAVLAAAAVTLSPTLRLQPLLQAPPLEVTTRGLSLLPKMGA